MEQQTTQENGAEDRPLYNSRIIQNYLKLVRKNYPHVDVDKVLAHAGMETFQVEDGGHWFTQSQINRFHEKLEPMSGSANISKEAGAYVASGEGMGDVTKYIMRLMSPARAYELIGRTKKTVFNVSQPDQNTVTKKVKLKRGTAMKVECDAHDFMHAFVFVAKNPYFAVVKDDGSFEIKDVPAGKYTIKAWHGFLKDQKGKVEVAAGGAATIDFAFKGK